MQVKASGLPCTTNYESDQLKKPKQQAKKGPLVYICVLPSFNLSFHVYAVLQRKATASQLPMPWLEQVLHWGTRERNVKNVKTQKKENKEY